MGIGQRADHDRRILAVTGRPLLPEATYCGTVTPYAAHTPYCVLDVVGWASFGW